MYMYHHKKRGHTTHNNMYMDMDIGQHGWGEGGRGGSLEVL